VVEAEQPYLRGGKHAPLTAQELEAKFLANADFGGISHGAALAIADVCRTLFDAPDFTRLALLRG
jgi:hypothetical protein